MKAKILHTYDLGRTVLFEGDVTKAVQCIFKTWKKNHKKLGDWANSYKVLLPESTIYLSINLEIPVIYITQDDQLIAVIDSNGVVMSTPVSHEVFNAIIELHTAFIAHTNKGKN